MRASFFLVLAVALLVGLGVAVAVKALGLLTPATVIQPVVETKIIVPEPKPVPPNVLVATRNLYADDTIRQGDVYVRPARKEEEQELAKNKADFVQPVVEAVYFRFASGNIEADTLIRKSMLKGLAKPEALNARLAPGTRAVNVGVTKGNSAGGLISVGDWVDLYLTTDVARTDETNRNPHTGLLVQHAQIIAKRDTLWSAFAPQPNETTIQYTLAANPYRAGLLDFTKTLGHLTMVPVSQSEKKKLDELKQVVMNDPSKPVFLSTGDPNSDSAKAEVQRIHEYETGTLSLGGDDLMKVLNLKPLPSPLPPPPPPVSVEIYTGVNKQTTAVFPQTTNKQPSTPQAKYLFLMPGTTGGRGAITTDAAKPESLPSSGLGVNLIAPVRQ